MKRFWAAVLGLCFGVTTGVAIADRDGSGTFTLYTPGNPVVSGTTISTTWANNTLSDIADALTDSIAKDGQTDPTADLPMAGFKHTLVANADARNQYAAVNQVQDGDFHTVTSVAGTDTITGLLVPAVGSYTAGMTIVLTPANTNTGAATLNLNGVGAVDILKDDGDALIAGDLVDGTPAFLIADEGADDFILVNPQTYDFNGNADISGTLNLGGALTGTIGSFSGTSPSFNLVDTDADADESRWTMTTIAGGTLSWRAYEDDLGSNNAFLNVTRTGVTIDEVEINATALDFNASADISGALTIGTDLAVTEGGTGASDASTARTNLGLAIGTNVQAFDAELSEIAALADTDSNFIVGNGSAWVAESGATARTSLGLGSIATQAANSVSISGGSITGITDLAVADGGTGASDAATALANLGGAAESASTFSSQTVTSCSGTEPTVTFAYTKIGSIVVLELTEDINCTSDTTSFAMTSGDLPAAVRPASDQCISLVQLIDNSARTEGTMRLTTTGDIIFGVGGDTNTDCGSNEAGFTASGNKQLYPLTATYHLN